MKKISRTGKKKVIPLHHIVRRLENSYFSKERFIAGFIRQTRLTDHKSPEMFLPGFAGCTVKNFLNKYLYAL